MPSFDGPPPGIDPELMLAIMKLLERSGMKEFQIRYDEEQKPVVWVAVALFKRPALRLPGKGLAEEKSNTGSQCGCGFTPIGAVRDLAENAVTGGTCTHCGRMIEVNFGDDEPAFPPTMVCYRKYDPEAKEFKRSCDSAISN